MSTLEQGVRPILEPLILGQKTRLSAQDAAVFSAWLMKTAYVSQGLGNWFATDEEMRTFAGNPHRPPPDFRAWIGAWRGGGGGDVWTHAWEWAEDRNARGFIANSHFTVFAIGHLTVIVTRSPDPNLIAYGPLGLWRLYLRQLWPITRTLIWPPTLKMTGDRVLNLRKQYIDGLSVG